jgi:hypothetical protein
MIRFSKIIPTALQYNTAGDFRDSPTISGQMASIAHHDHGGSGRRNQDVSFILKEASHEVRRLGNPSRLVDSRVAQNNNPPIRPKVALLQDVGHEDAVRLGAGQETALPLVDLHGISCRQLLKGHHICQD